MSRIIIRQPAGLGDIIFCQKIAHTYRDRGHEVVWPVIPHYLYIGEYLPDFNYVDKWSVRSLEDVEINLCNAIDASDYSKLMVAKYETQAMDWHDWQKYVHLKRNKDREQSLYDKYVRAEPYSFTNRLFATPPDQTVSNVVIKCKYPIVDMVYNSNENPFDWCLVMERAQEIHTVDTCFSYLVELLNCKAERYCLYPKKPYSIKIPTKSIMTVKPWEFCE